MELKHSKNINQAVDGMQKISALAWSPNGKKLAVSTADRVVHLFDEHGEKKDKFPTKPSDKNQKSYIIRGVSFSPDSQKIAIAQSDNIVFVYKIGTEWGERKSICNKFPASSSVVALCWPREYHGEVVFGLVEGKVKMGVLRNNKSVTLYSGETSVTALATSKSETCVVSGHMDGSVYVYDLGSQAHQKLFTHTCEPYGLGWGEHFVCAGNDSRICFYDMKGNMIQEKDYNDDPDIMDFNIASFNMTGDMVAVGNFNRFFVFSYNPKMNRWDEVGTNKVESYYSVTAMCWKNDSTKLVLGSLCGSVDIFDISMKKLNYKSKLEFNYIAQNHIITKDLDDPNKRLTLKSKHGREFSSIMVHHDRFVIAQTPESIVLADMQYLAASEIQWQGSLDNLKFDFSSPRLCLIVDFNEAQLIEFGNDEILSTIKSQFLRPKLISAVVNYDYTQGADENFPKAVAFLLDAHNITVQDLNSLNFIANINNECKVEALSLSNNCKKLIFRDKKKALYIVDLATQQKSVLLSFCTFSEWVPGTDVLIAQNKEVMGVWYSIDSPDKVTNHPIKGEIEKVERLNGKTQITSNENGNPIKTVLDEPLIEFQFALDQGHILKACDFLEGLEMNSEIESNWKNLGDKAIEQQDLMVAERCFTALGDIPKANYLSKIIKTIPKEVLSNSQNTKTFIHENNNIQAALAVLQKDLQRAQNLYLEQNELEKAMDMYQELHKWEDAIKVAAIKSQAQANELKKNYFDWLLETKQHDRAGQIKQQEEDYLNAVNLYCEGGNYLRAANVIIEKYDKENFSTNLVEDIAKHLIEFQMFDLVGQLYEKLEMTQKAIDMYVKGKDFRRALDLARVSDPSKTKTLQVQYGNYLAGSKNYDRAIDCFRDAGDIEKAVQLCLQSRRWSKAIDLLDKNSNLPNQESFYKQIGEHFREMKQLDLAEKYFVRGNFITYLLIMYVEENKFEKAMLAATKYLNESLLPQVLSETGHLLYDKGYIKEAEQMFLRIQKADEIIERHKKAKQFDKLINLVAKYKPNMMANTNQLIAQSYEQDKNFERAQDYYLKSGLWAEAMQMYERNNLWAQGLKLCKVNGSPQDLQDYCRRWVDTVGAQQSIGQFVELNLQDQLIEYLIQKSEFDLAFKIAHDHAKHRLSDVHYYFGLSFEDQGKLKEAEEEFIKAGKPEEAIDMYEEKEMLDAALQVAQQYVPPKVNTILLEQSKQFIKNGDFDKAEKHLTQAGKPELAIKMYQKIGKDDAAQALAQRYFPNAVEEVLRN